MAKNNKKMIGAVLVQGGGIAGVQASLDLADSGFKVYLVERSPAIGGMMSMLDKTFPTGDCATCIVSPKLVECARNLNIEILTLSELVSLEGEFGRFRAVIRQNPRFVDEQLCTGCGDCIEACPVTILNRFDRNLGIRKAIAKHFAQAVPNVCNILKQGHAPCKNACPAGVNVQGYIQLISKKEYIKAVNLIRERNPLSAICGRVCNHPCEDVCNRGNIDSPVAIRLLKRFASDKEMEMIESGEYTLPEEKTPPSDARKIAIVGAGPAGLTAAYELSNRGFAVTVFEAYPKAGGMLRYGIPYYRLPENVLDHEIDLIRRSGVKFVFNRRLSKDITITQLRLDFDAVFVAVGAHSTRVMSVTGEELGNVLSGLEFLSRASTYIQKPQMSGKTVVVIGGGDVAIDSARTALRMGAEKVTVVYRRSRLEMPALDGEIRHAEKEGIKFIFLAAPIKFLAGLQNRVRGVRCVRMELGKPDKSGRRRPVTVPGSEFELEVDTIIIAIGQMVDHKIIEHLQEEVDSVVDVSHGVEFLRQSVIDKEKPEVGENVIVIGGGNVAVDVARTALRLGARHVQLVSLEKREEMPAYTSEVEATIEEGITIYNGWGPRRILGEISVEGIEFKHCISVFDEKGHFNPVFDENDLMTLKADHIIVAIGQMIDDTIIEHLGVETDHGFIKADPVTLETSLEGVFSGGDAISGAVSVIESVADGKRAADSIERYLRNEDLRAPRFEDTVKQIPEELLPSLKDVEKMERSIPGELTAEERIENFTEVETGFDEEMALAECERCLNCAQCSECLECVAACEQDAIDHTMTERRMEIDVGSVILTPGFEEFQAEVKGEYGFGRYQNVITSVQFERMLSASGPFEGHIVRRSDGHEARRIAFVQCVGSRDSGCGKDYCSSICCMAATKQAIIAREHEPELDVHIFYMDIRAYGKNFDQYYERARSDSKVHYVKSIPSRVLQVPGTKDLQLRFVSDSGEFEEQDFDLVILSVGLEPAAYLRDNASNIGIDLNRFGFCATDRLSPLETSRPGVYVAGAFQEPKDIPETVTQASAAASFSMELLAEARNTLITKKEYPDERDITDEPPRIGVFICHCGRNIASVVDVERVTEVASHQPDVVSATHAMYTCSDTTLSEIRDTIYEKRLNRIVVASCTPRTHEPLFRETLREAGLNPYLFELANIRDQDSWVHSSEPEAATEKAIELVCMSIARARRLVPLTGGTLSVEQSALVIGGGLSGMTAALALAEQGFRVSLVERSDVLGGNLLNLHYTLEHDDISGFTDDLVNRVKSQGNITLFLETEVTAVGGHIGKFRVTLSGKSEETEITCGTIIVSTGAVKAEATEYLYDSSDAVITQIELEKLLHDGAFPAEGKNVVMVQCVGSRNEEKPYCSRICCSMAVKNALRIKEQNPESKVFVLYRDMRTYGFRETFYRKAREAGVLFIRYDQDSPPVVTEDNGLVVTVDTPDFPETIEIEADYVVLSTGVETPEDNKRLSDILKVPINSEGFYVEAHLKLRPVDFATEGIFLCGLAHSPKFIDENISQARAAAARAATVLSKAYIDVSAEISHVDQNKCISCMTCVKACPYTAPFVNADNKAQIEGAKCMGCGICVAECPAEAIQLSHFETVQFETMLDDLFASEVIEELKEPLLVQQLDTRVQP
ncbi:FAD-dependent oxidoreductase [Candidatus Latescibacterota bacterium]